MRNCEAEKAEQALHVAALVIEKMRAALPGTGRHAGQPREAAETLTVAREHDRMVTGLIVALGPFVGKLNTEITLKTPHADGARFAGGYVTLECSWKAQGNEATRQQGSKATGQRGNEAIGNRHKALGLMPDATEI